MFSHKTLLQAEQGRHPCFQAVFNGESVCLKKYTLSNSGTFRKLLKEASYSTRLLSNPFVAQVLFVFCELGSAYLVMPLYAGTLVDLQPGGNVALDASPQNDDTRRSICVQLLLGLLDIHSEGITHFDIKPANIFYMWSPATADSSRRKLQVLLGDFDVSKDSKARLNATKTMAATTAIRGTPDYMAPEVAFPVRDSKGTFLSSLVCFIILASYILECQTLSVSDTMSFFCFCSC